MNIEEIMVYNWLYCEDDGHGNSFPIRVMPHNQFDDFKSDTIRGMVISIDMLVNQFHFHDFGIHPFENFHRLEKDEFEVIYIEADSEFHLPQSNKIVRYLHEIQNAYYMELGQQLEKDYTNENFPEG